MNAVVEVKTELDKMLPQFKMVLPEQVTPEKFMRIVQTSLQMNPDLLAADRRSLLGACMKAAQDGLLPDGREGAFVTFWDKKNSCNQVQWMPMVTGILKKVRNSGELVSLTSNVVHQKDEFNYWIDDIGEHLTHKPAFLEQDRGPIIAAYALARTKAGGLYTEIMSKSQIEQVREVSRAKDGGPWKSWWSEMARKTVIRRLAKKLPMSTDLEQVIQRDDDMYDFQQAKQVASSGNDAVKAALGLDMPTVTPPESDVVPWEAPDAPEEVQS